jgi:hypothetical protein
MTIGKRIFKVLCKIVGVIIVLYTLFYVLLLLSCTNTEKYDEIESFPELINAVKGAENNIPNIEELGDYESVELHHKSTEYLLWQIETLTLNVRYETEKFESALDQINLKYTFLTESKEDLLDCDAEIDGYQVKVVDKTEKMQYGYSYDYPKCFMMIGINEHERKIVYLYHYDIDLDLIKDLDDFIKKYYVFE